MTLVYSSSVSFYSAETPLTWEGIVSTLFQMGLSQTGKSKLKSPTKVLYETSYFDTLEGKLAQHAVICKEDKRFSTLGVYTLPSAKTPLQVVPWQISVQADSLKNLLQLDQVLSNSLGDRPLVKILNVNSVLQQHYFKHPKIGELVVQLLSETASSSFSLDASVRAKQTILTIDYLSVKIVPWQIWVLELQETLKLQMIHHPDTHYETWLNLLNIPSNRNKVKNLIIQPTLNFDQGAKQCLNYFYNLLTLNLQGIIVSDDIEYLHDFRVALRHLRTLLRMFSAAWDDPGYLALRESLRELGNKTGSLRDLDVMLSEFSDFHQFVAPTERTALLKYHDFLKQRQFEQKNLLSEYLGSPEFTTSLAALKQFVSSAKSSASGKEPMVKWSGTLVHLRWQKVIKRGQKLTSTAGFAQFHQLRIECKKLRYALEALHSFHPQITPDCVNDLKALQDILGRMQDAVVQEIQIRDHLLAMNSQESNLALTLCCGQLIQSMRQQQLKMKNAFFAAFNRLLLHDDFFVQLTAVKSALSANSFDRKQA